MKTDGFAFVEPTTDPDLNLYFNGKDTVIVAYPSTTAESATNAGYLVFYTKGNNGWNSQIITADDVQLGYESAFGSNSFGVINQNTLVFGAPPSRL